MDSAALKALLGPLSQQLFDSLIWPMVLAEAAKVTDPALAPLLASIEGPVKAAIDAELAKL